MEEEKKRLSISRVPDSTLKSALNFKAGAINSQDEDNKPVRMPGEDKKSSFDFPVPLADFVPLTLSRKFFLSQFPPLGSIKEPSYDFEFEESSDLKSKPTLSQELENPESKTSATALFGKVLSLEEMHSYVRERLPTAAQDEISALAAIVAHSPLALAQAVNYIVAGHCTLADYPNRFAQHQRSFGDKLAAIEPALHAVFTTAQLNLAGLEKQHPCIFLLLNIAAFLAPEGIPCSLLQDQLLPRASYSDAVLKEGLAALISRGLLQLNAQQELSIPSQLQQVVRQQLSMTEQHQQLGEVMQFVADVYLAMQHTDELRKTFLPHLQALVKQHDISGRSEDSDFALVLFFLGNIYGELGDTQRQRDLLQRALQIQRGCGTGSKYIISTLINLSNAYGAVHDTNKQCALLEDAVNLQEVYYCSREPKRIPELVRLSKLYGVLGEIKKQRACLVKLLRIQIKYYKTAHVEVAQTLIDLGNACGESGHRKKQCERLERAVQIQEKCYGTRAHPVIASTLVYLGNAYGASDDVDKQCKLLREAVQIQEKCYGTRTHEEIASTLVYLANAYGALGNTEKQLNLLKEAVGIQKHLGTNHLEIAKTLLSLGHIYYQSTVESDMAQCSALREEALYLLEKSYGYYDLRLVNTLWDLSATYEALNNKKQQRQLLERILQIQLRYYGDEDQRVLATLVKLAIILKQLNLPHDALCAAQCVYLTLVSNPRYGERPILIQSHLNELLGGGFTMAQLRASISESSEKKGSRPSTFGRGTPGHFPPPRYSSEIDRDLGQAVVGLVDAISKQLREKYTGSWDPCAPAMVAGLVVNACAKGPRELNAQLRDPLRYSIPAVLVPVLRSFVHTHALLGLAQRADLAKTLIKALQTPAGVGELRQLYGSLPEDKTKALTDDGGWSCPVM